MTLTDLLLLAVLLAVLAVLAHAEYSRRQTARWLDAIGDMIGDMLRALLDELRKEKDE